MENKTPGRKSTGDYPNRKCFSLTDEMVADLETVCTHLGKTEAFVARKYLGPGLASDLAKIEGGKDNDPKG